MFRSKKYRNIILTAFYEVEGELNSTQLYKALEAKMKSVSPGSMYTQLDGLIKEGAISRREGPPQPNRGNRKRFYYSLTEIGRAAYLEKMAADLLAGPQPTVLERMKKVLGFHK